MADYKFKRLTLFAGHYGSGKTNLAVNFAKAIKKAGHPVKIADLDVVNPYFRSKDSQKELEDQGIQLISSVFANSNVDLPALPQEVYSIVQRKDCYAVIDVGGDDRGAYALGRYTPYILEENDYEMIFVANFFRPLTRTAQEAFEVMQEIQLACKINLTAIINNSNLGKDTTAQSVLSTTEQAQQLSKLSGLPIIATTCTKQVANQLNVNGVMEITLQDKYFDVKEN